MRGVGGHDLAQSVHAKTEYGCDNRRQRIAFPDLPPQRKIVNSMYDARLIPGLSEHPHEAYC